MPFKHDIIRSKRWIPGGGNIQHQWDWWCNSVTYNTVSKYLERCRKLLVQEQEKKVVISTITII